MLSPGPHYRIQHQRHQIGSRRDVATIETVRFQAVERAKKREV